MKLQRENFCGSDVYGEWYAADDVDALLARIRAALMAERHAAFVYERAYDAERNGRPTPTGSVVRFAEWNAARAATEAALDALLADGECSTLCAPGSGERCMVTDSGRCPNGGS